MTDTETKDRQRGGTPGPRAPGPGLHGKAMCGTSQDQMAEATSLQCLANVQTHRKQDGWTMAAWSLPVALSLGTSEQVFSWAMRSKGVSGRCRPQYGQVQKVRRQSLYRSVSLCTGAGSSQPG